MMGNRVSVIGLGKLGLPLTAAFLARGYDVVGVDADPAKLLRAGLGAPACVEPKVSAILELYKDHIDVTNDAAEAVGRTDATVIMVDTPTGSDGLYYIDNVVEACRAVGRGIAVKKRAGDVHLVIVSSTVNPGDCGSRITHALTDASGGGEGWKLAYVPEFVALGEAVRGFTEPDFVLVGADDPMAGKRAALFLDHLPCRVPPTPFIHRNFVDAEIAKIALNFWLTTKIAFGNMLGQLCEDQPGADAGAMIETMGLDRRVCPAYMRPGGPAGGPCFPRDLLEMKALLPGDALVHGVADANHQQYMHVLRLALAAREWNNGHVIAVLGTAFKPGTDCADGALGDMLANDLKSMRVIAWDPLLGGDVDHAQAAVEAADVVVLATADERWRALRFREGQAVVDVWRMLDGYEDALSKARWWPVGRWSDGTV